MNRDTCIGGVNVLLPYVSMSVQKHSAHLIWYSVKHQIICCEVLLCGSTTTLLMSDSDLYEKRKHKSKGSERRTTEREIRKTTDIAQNKS